MDDFLIKPNSSGTSFEVNFTSTQLCSAVGRLEFCSRLLYKLAPDREAIWHETPTPRVNAHIVGFPQEISWKRTDDSTLIGTSTSSISKVYFETLSSSIKAIKGSKKSEFNVTEFGFSIHDNSKNKTYDYIFDSRSRALVTLCVLWDGGNHPRDHLEVWRDPSVPFLADYPPVGSGTKEAIKTYGDPSKTVDELRNQGFPRNTDQSPRGISLDITRATSYNTKQEHYKLVNRTQSQVDRVGRSQIPDKYKKQLYQASGYTCSNCGQKYSFEYLAPDHRVPSIVQSDNLTASNFKEVLQTLCVRCNQVKREACKKCPYEHKCDLCAWAYPEKLGVSKASFDMLKSEADKLNLSINELVLKTFK